MKNYHCSTCGQELRIKALEAVVPSLCPACEPVYALARNVSQTESGSSPATGAANAVCFVLLAFAGAKIIDDLFFS